jgi:hypothetical protein
MIELVGFGLGWLLGKKVLFPKRKTIDYYDEDFIDLITYLEICKNEQREIKKEQPK